MIKINMFGDGVRVHICDLEPDLYYAMLNDKVDAPWELVLFDPDFLNKFGFNHWSELSSFPEIIGFKLVKEGVVEIKKKAKKLARFLGDEMVVKHTLFAVYHTVLKELPNPSEKYRRLILVAYEKGLVHSFSIAKEEVVMTDLEFEIQQFDLDLYCIGINHDRVQIKSSKNDTVVRGVRVLTE